jgi:hypothetical protein
VLKCSSAQVLKFSSSQVLSCSACSSAQVYAQVSSLVLKCSSLCSSFKFDYLTMGYATNTCTFSMWFIVAVQTHDCTCRKGYHRAMSAHVENFNKCYPKTFKTMSFGLTTCKWTPINTWQLSWLWLFKHMMFYHVIWVTAVSGRKKAFLG